MSYIELALQVTLGLFFAASGGSKALRLGSFRRAVAAYQILPKQAESVTSVAVPLVELFVAVALIGNDVVLPAAVCAIALLVIFSAAMATNLQRKRRVPCGCFGRSDDAMISWWLVGRNVVLGVATAMVATLRLVFIPGSIEWAPLAIIVASFYALTFLVLATSHVMRVHSRLTATAVVG